MLGGGFTFSQVPVADIPRSTFNRSHGHKTTFDSGYLVPIFIDEALPGDTFQVQASVFARLATPIVPIMDNMHMDVFFFFVPNRLIWSNWQKFMGEQDNPGDSTDYLVPEVQAPPGGFPVGSVFDYFGYPTGSVGNSKNMGTALFYRAYRKIWNEWFRDENLQDSVSVPLLDGPDTVTVEDCALLKRGKRHDYFTSCLPWPQKGPGASINIGDTAPVIPNVTGADTDVPYFVSSNGLNIGPLGAATQTGDQNRVYFAPAGGNNQAGNLHWNAQTGLIADLSANSVVTINALREAFQIQKLMERDARGGTRYTEILRSHFGVVSPDSRLQRSEYLGGGTVPVVINPVTQTSGTPNDSATGYTPTPQGNLAGYGVAGGSHLGFSKSFVEHGVILGMVMVRADLSYQQGLPRMLSRRTRYDYYWPAFSHLGEQAVLNKEIYYQGTAQDDEVFGYQERWAEYRYYPSKITGKYRSTDPQSLDFWHLAQEFTTLPVLSAAFIEENPPIDRVIAVPSEPQFLFDSHFNMKCTRPMPTYSVPGLIDHF
ncbi:MAG: major capsid protein [Microviridae sp.]|nr:MAG: major capsid protein [Microviridae sp.]